MPSGDLAQLFDRAVDVLLEHETRRRMGIGPSIEGGDCTEEATQAGMGGCRKRAHKPRRRRAQKPGSRHIPVEVQRAVRERDCNRCTFVDEHGHRCSETRFLTIEHDWPFAFGGPPTVENCRLLCAGHNAYTARQVFGQKHIERKIVRARQDEQDAQGAAKNGSVYGRVLSALMGMGFKRECARQALDAIAPEAGAEPELEVLLRAALDALTPR